MMGKATSIYEAARGAVKRRARNEKVVTTNGVFDILHAGHVDYLKRAKALGDALFVAVNSDDSVKINKGDKRPINPLEDRMTVLAALECVDYVFSFGERDPCAWLEKIKPAVHVKGGDYKMPLIEQGVVEKNGGRVVLIPAVKGKSTTSIIEKIKSVYCQ